MNHNIVNIIAKYNYVNDNDEIKINKYIKLIRTKKKLIIHSYDNQYYVFDIAKIEGWKYDNEIMVIYIYGKKTEINIDYQLSSKKKKINEFMIKCIKYSTQ